jgi:hypothetical protein
VSTPDTAERRLPSERGRLGDPRLVGFLNDPPGDHIRRVGEALEELAVEVSMTAPTEAERLRVCLCSVRLPPRLPFRLYGFAFQTLDERGRPSDPFAERAELRYGLIVNQPLDLQREAALSFLFDLVLRQAPVRDFASSNQPAPDRLPELAAEAEGAANEASSDLLRFGWKRTAQALRSRTAEAGFRLEVKYQADPFPTRAEVVSRMPALRRLYNRNEQVREAVDRTVSIIGGREPQTRGGREDIRVSRQQGATLSGLRQFLNQTQRDADVCGNGYLVMGAFAGLPRLRCLLPDAVEICGDEYVLLGGKTEERFRDVFHDRGLEQIHSPYGISPWEPLLSYVQQADTINGIRATVRAARARLPPDASARKRAERFAKLAERMERQADERVAELTRFAREHLPPAASGLYFRGQESYAQEAD